MGPASPSLPQRRFDIPHTDAPALPGIHLPLATRRRFGVTNESGVGRHSLRTAGAAVAHFLHMEGVTSSNHPRACREHDGGLTALLHLQGSSPRMQGTPTQAQNTTYGAGIIPAHAGNTPSNWPKIVS